MSDRLAAALAELVEALREEARVAAMAPLALERLLDIGEAAATLAVSRGALYAEIGAGRLRSIKVGRRRLVPAAAIAEYVEAASRTGSREAARQSEGRR